MLSAALFCAQSGSAHSRSARTRQPRTVTHRGGRAIESADEPGSLTYPIELFGDIDVEDPDELFRLAHDAITRRDPKPCPAAAETPTPMTGSAHGRVYQTGCVTLRVNGHLHHIGVGRTHARTHVILLVQDLNIRIVNAVTGELLRELVLDPNVDYQPTGAPKGPTRPRP